MNEASKSDSQKVYILRQADYNFANMFGELILFFQKKIVRPYFLLNQEGGNLWRNGFTDDAYSRQSWQIEPRLTTKQIGKNLISEEGWRISLLITLIQSDSVDLLQSDL